MSTTDSAPAPRRDPALLVVLGVLIVLVVVALLVVFTRGAPAQLDADTPSGVVQRYSAAVLDGDENLAATYLADAALADGAVAGCDGASAPVTDNIRVTLLGTTERTDSADVRVSIVTTYDSGPFGPNEYQSDDVFDLVVVDGDWLIAEAPWQLTICPTVQNGTP